MLELTGGRGADSAIEAVGRPELVGTAAGLLRPGGRIAVVGVIVQAVELPWALLLMKNLGVRTGLVNPQRHVSQSAGHPLPGAVDGDHGGLIAVPETDFLEVSAGER